MMNICYIFGGLPIEKLDFLPDDNDFIISADAGLNNTNKFGLKPNIVIGDFDSLGYVPKIEKIEKLTVRKDDTDVGYAIKYAFNKGYNRFIVYGAIGGLLDHTVANLQLSEYISKRNGKALFIGEKAYITSITNSSIDIENGVGRISVFALSGIAKGVFEKGLSYSLENATLYPDFPLGVSNEFTDKKATVSVKDGTLTIISESAIKLF